jgi:selenium metabolism protein YedF
MQYMQTVDARGLACPQPVILARKALAIANEIMVIVDNDTAQLNVTRMAEKEGCRVVVEHKPDGIYLQIAHLKVQTSVQQQKRSVVVLVPGDTMGRGDAELGAVLIRAFFHTLTEAEPLPSCVIFINSGVHLVTESSAIAPDLRALADRGVEILACGTCLNHFGLKDKVAVGQISNMYTIAETLLRADNVTPL